MWNLVVINRLCLENLEVMCCFVGVLQIFLNDLLETTTHVVCDRTYGCAGKTFSDVRGCLGSIWLDPYHVNVFEASLDFFRCDGDGVLPTSQVFLERFKWVQLKTFVSHKLPCFGQGILFAGEFGIVDINAEDDLQRWMEIE